MKRKTNSFHVRFLVFFLSLSTFHVATAKPGFFAPDDKQIPEKVQKASRSIFRLVNLGQKIMPLNSKEWATDYEAGKTVLENSLKKGNLDVLDKSVLQAQLNICEKAGKEIRDCNLMFGFEYSTAFTTRNGTELWTTFHSLRHYLHLLLKENMADFTPHNPIEESQISEAMAILKSHPIPIVLSDKDNKIVFESAAGQEARLDIISEKAIPFIWSYDWQSAYTLSEEDTKTFDYVRLKLSKPVGQGLMMNLSPPPAGESLFITGFPKITFDRKTLQAPDSNGRNQYTTIGKRLNLSQLRSRLEGTGFNWSRGLDVDSVFSEQGALLAGDNDGTGQMSGSPLLTSEGAVIGIYQGSTDDALKSVTSFSASLQPILQPAKE